MRSLILPILATLALASCVGNQARQETLVPVANQIWPGVRVDYDAGLADGLADGDLTPEVAADLTALADDLTEILDSGVRVELYQIPWEQVMAPWAVRGVTSAVEAGELGPNGATLLIERINNFTAIMATLRASSIAAWNAEVSERERGPTPPNPYILTPGERRILASLNR